MSTPNSVADCIHIGYGGVVYNARYFAMPTKHLGMCIYTVPPTEDFHFQFFPIYGWDQHAHYRVLGAGDGSVLQEAYVTFVSKMATAGKYSDYMRQRYRQMYPYGSAPDLLTMKCLLKEYVVKFCLAYNKEHHTDD